MRTLLILAFLAVAAGAGMKSAPEPAPKVANVDGEAVIPGKLIGAKPMFEVKNVQFWDGKLATTGAQCTIVTGDVWNMTEGDGWAVDVEVDVWAGTKSAGHVGVAKAHIERVGVKVPVAFRALLPGCYVKQYWDDGCRILHSARLTVMPAKPFGEK